MTDQTININASTSLNEVSCSELEQRITNLQNADFKSLSIEEVRNQIAHIIHQCPIEPRELQLSGVWRARKNKTAEPFTNTKDLWYPPSSSIKKPGRLNELEQSRFYASDTANTVILELKPTVGDIITVLTARTKKKDFDTLNKIVFIGIEHSHSDKVQHFSNEDTFRTSLSFRKSLGESNYKKWLLVNDYLCSILTKEVELGCEHDYKPTIALAHLLFAIPDLDAINYPSVATEAHGINICMLPDKADRYFTPSEAWMIKIEAQDRMPNTNNVLPRFRFLRKSKQITSDGIIEWLPQGVRLTYEENTHFFGSKVEILSEFPKPY
jgi:RES domain